LGQRSKPLSDLGCSTVAIAVSAVYAQQAFARSLDLPFPLLSDWGGATSRAYGVEYHVWKGHAGLAKRSVFVVDAGGIIRYRWVTDDAAVQPDFDAVETVVAAIAA